MRRSPASALRRLDYELRSLISARRERDYDRRLGIRTSGRHGHSDLASARPEAEHAGIYQGAPSRRFGALIAALPVVPAVTTFLDLGCGKGKALFLAADLGFRRVIGVEFAPDLAEAAQANARAYAAVRPGAAPVEIVCADAATYELPPEPTVLFLYNPFEAPVMDRVRARVDSSLRASPRPFWVVYLNPRQATSLDQARSLRRMPLSRELLAPEPARLFRDLRGHEHGADLEAVVYEGRTSS